MLNIEQHPATVDFNLCAPRNQPEQDTLDFEITLAQRGGQTLSMDIYESIVSVLFSITNILTDVMLLIY